MLQDGAISPPRHEADVETELRLGLSAEVIEQVWAALPCPADTVAHHQQLTSIYYDTADLRLRQLGLGLRVRHDGRQYVQTIKSDTESAASLSRSEWEWQVTGPTPALEVIDTPCLRDRLADITAATLLPIFFVEYSRRSTLLSGNAVEAALDCGMLRTRDGAEQPIFELELELKAGATEQLYELALTLLATLKHQGHKAMLATTPAPFWLEARSKAARGYQMMAGGPPQAVHPPRMTLPEDVSTENALAAIVGGCLGHLIANIPCALSSDANPESIHQIRVAIRRLRSALTVFQPLLPAGDHAWLDAESRWLANRLGPAREWDVFLNEMIAPVRAAPALLDTGDDRAPDTDEDVNTGSDAGLDGSTAPGGCPPAGCPPAGCPQDSAGASRANPLKSASGTTALDSASWTTALDSASWTTALDSASRATALDSASWATALDNLAAVADTCRRDAYRQARESLQSCRFTELVLRLGGWLEGKAWRQQPLSETALALFAPAADYAGPMLESRRGKVLKAGRRLGQASAERKHRLRIRLKKLRYTIEFFRTLYPERAVHAHLPRLAKLQEQFGRLNDVATSARLITQCVAAAPPAIATQVAQAGGLVVGWHAHAVADSDQTLHAEWQEVRSLKPFW